MEQQTLKGAAEQEALQAEAEFKNKSKGRKKPNGKAKPNGDAAVTSKPGEQGVATQEPPADKPPPIWTRPDVSKKDLSNAEQVFKKLDSDAQDMKPEAVIDALIAVVDVLPELTIPAQWPGEASEEYRHAPIVERIGLLLCRGCPNIEISGRKVGFL